MKTLLLLLFSTCCCFGQGVKEIVVTSQQANEPPSIPGPARHHVIFKQTKNGDFAVSAIEEHSKKVKTIKLNGQIKIPRQKVDQTISWISSGKTAFSISDLQIDPQLINKKLEAHSLVFTESIDKSFVVKVDSFSLCSSFDTKRSISTGGTALTVTIKFEHAEEKSYKFHSSDFGTNRFNIQDYLTLYPLLNNKLPSDHLSADLFNEKVLVEVLHYYLKIIECEDYYYKEFVSKHPNRTPQENRAKAGWDFEGYMNNKNKQKVTTE
jgi:hypothetical protein